MRKKGKRTAKQNTDYTPGLMQFQTSQVSLCVDLSGNGGTVQYIEVFYFYEEIGRRSGGSWQKLFFLYNLPSKQFVIFVVVIIIIIIIRPVSFCSGAEPNDNSDCFIIFPCWRITKSLNQKRTGWGGGHWKQEESWVSDSSIPSHQISRDARLKPDILNSHPIRADIDRRWDQTRISHWSH